MKNFLLLISFFCLFALGVTPKQAQAQTTYTFTADTLTNVDAVTMQYVTRVSRNNVAAIAVTATEISGAATAVCHLDIANVDGEWYTKTADAALITAGSPDVATYVFELADTPFKYVRIRTSQTGTAVTQVISTWVFKDK
jgi:nicotinamide mononucleotide (NMN) deamidase PncC